MDLKRTISLLLALGATAAPASAQNVTAAGDTLVLLVKSPRGQETSFSGTIVFRDLRTTRRFENVQTPFELRLPLNDVDAHFSADDGRALSGEILVFKGGERRGHVEGTVYRGTVKLHHEPGASFGFGGRNLLQRILP